MILGAICISRAISSSPISSFWLIVIDYRHKLRSIDNPKHEDFQFRKLGISPHCFNLNYLFFLYIDCCYLLVVISSTTYKALGLSQTEEKLVGLLHYL